MTKRILSGVILTACLFIASCGGNGGSGTAALGTFSTGPSSEINAGNALLVARVANLAVIRYLAYRDLTATIFERALSLSPAVPSSVSCGGPSDGLLGISTLSATAFNVTLQSCRATSDVILNSGIVAVDGLSISPGGSPASFNTSANAIQITDRSGTSTVSGNVGYHRTLVSTVSASGQSESHTGQLDFARGGRTDQYRNIAITTGLVTGGATPGVAVAISRLEITSPRVAVSKIQVVTPGPLTFGTSPAPGSSDVLLANSMADGSLVQVDYIGTTAFRLRSWDSRGNQVLDVMKNNSDADVVAADAAAAS